MALLLNAAVLTSLLENSLLIIREYCRVMILYDIAKCY